MGKKSRSFSPVAQERETMGRYEQHKPKKSKAIASPAHSEIRLDPRLAMSLIFGMTMLPNVRLLNP